jgi:hypothetical protein
MMCSGSWLTALRYDKQHSTNAAETSELCRVLATSWYENFWHRLTHQPLMRCHRWLSLTDQFFSNELLPYKRRAFVIAECRDSVLPRYVLQPSITTRLTSTTMANIMPCNQCRVSHFRCCLADVVCARQMCPTARVS